MGTTQKDQTLCQPPPPFLTERETNHVEGRGLADDLRARKAPAGSITKRNSPHKPKTTAWSCAGGFHLVFFLFLFRTLFMLVQYTAGVDPQKPHPNRFLEVRGLILLG